MPNKTYIDARRCSRKRKGKTGGIGIDEAILLLEKLREDPLIEVDPAVWTAMGRS